MDVEAKVAVVIDEAIRLARVSDKLTAALTDVERLIGTLGDVATYEPRLAPEISAALEATKPVSDAISRAHGYAVTRFSVVMEQLNSEEDDDAQD